jgi:lipoprotein-anchoring transpeptidase ErfK/SrfK
MTRISAIRAFAFAAIAGAALTTTASANPLVLGYAPQDTRSVETMTEPDAGFQQVARFKRQIVSYYTTEAPGTIIIDTPNTYLYLVLGNGRAMRYGIGVGREGFTWSGTQTITKKAEWPDWHPPQEMIERQPYLPRFMAGGPGNPLGARAMYLGGTVYRIHGTNAPNTIGQQVSSGCIRLVNEDVVDLYSRVNVGTKVVVLPMIARSNANRVSALH